MAGNQSIRSMPEYIPLGGEFKICGNLPNCKKGAACTFAHSKEEMYAWNQQLKSQHNTIRSRPKSVSPPGGAFQLCKNISNCSYGDKCTYAHSEEEMHAWNKELQMAEDSMNSKSQEMYARNQQLKSQHNTIRSRPEWVSLPGGAFQLCKNISNCSYGDKCTYAHSEEEMHAWNKELQMAEDSMNSKSQEMYARNQRLKSQHNTIRSRPEWVSLPGGAFQLCKNISNCSYGDKCTYAHSEEEMHAWNKELQMAEDSMNSKSQGAAVSNGSIAATSKTGAKITSTDMASESGTQSTQGSSKYEKISKFSNNPNHKVKRIICNEVFEEHLRKYLQSIGMELNEVKEKYMDDAFEKAKYDYAEAEVECNAIQSFDPVDGHIGQPFDYRNDSDKQTEEEYDNDVEYKEGLEYTKTKCSEWNICGGLSAEYQGAGATATVSYTKRQSEEVKKIEVTTQTQHIKKKVSVPPKHFTRVVRTQRFQRHECKVKNAKLIFPKSAQITCKVVDKRDNKPRNLKKKYLIREVLKNYIDDCEADPLTARLEGKYVWVETSIFLDVGEPKPIIG